MKIWTTILLLLVMAATAFAQPDRKDVRKGNRQFRKENYPAADIHYRKALLADSTSVAAHYNLANTLYREEDFEQAGSQLGKIAQTAPATPHAADYFYNTGDVALKKKDYKAAVEAFAASLLIRPDDIDAKENYIYAKKMLQDQQQNGGGQGQNQDQNQDQNQNQDNNQNQDQNQDNNQNQDQNQDNNQDQNRDQNQNPQRQGISPQQAQQLLQAIQAEEKQTQDKVKKEKAAVLKSRQKEKNW